MNAKEMKAKINSGEFDEAFRRVYVTDEAVALQKPRYVKLIETFEEIFGGERDIYVMSAPGRTEICGNHTDHNNGKVLAASINLDAVAVVAQNDDNIIRVKSEGHNMNVVDLSDLEPKEGGYGHSTSMVKGVAARLKELGYKVSGFDACTASDVMGGSGLSSSAAFEVLLGTITSYLHNDGKIDPVTIAKTAQYSENVFFGKPCGLLDQMASSVGSFVTIDFEHTENPVIKKVDYDFSKSGHSLCIVDTGGNHSDLTDDYAAVRGEMEAVAEAMGKKVLREIEYDDFFAALPELQKKVNDRALIRAMHFYAENKRVDNAVNCLESGDFDCFRKDIVASGYSSFMYNQNVYTPKNPTDQRLSLALAMTQAVLGDRGAYRVHGGGFAGTIQAFVPNDMLENYKKVMEGVFGKGNCHVLIIRPIGGCRVL